MLKDFLVREPLKIQFRAESFNLTNTPHFANPGNNVSSRILNADGTERVLQPHEDDYQNNAMTVGGGTRVFGAQAWRFLPTDFAMASTYGAPPGSSLADWPIGYDDLAPYYQRAEWEIGVDLAAR